MWAINREQGPPKMFNMLSWTNNFILSYNTPVDLSTIGDEIPHLTYLLQQAMQYGGTQQLEILPAATRRNFQMVLNAWHPGRRPTVSILWCKDT